MRYPFTPELLDAIPEEAAELFRALELTLLEEIADRLTIAGKLNEVTISDIKALRSHGVDLAEIKKAIRATAGVSAKTLDAAIDDVIRFNEEYYGAVVTLADITKPDILVDAATIAAIRKQTQETFRNITRSMGFLVDAGRTMLAPAKAYQWALDSAVMQMQSGAVSYGQAIANATRQLADSGLKVVEYESGHVDQADVAVRRAVLTSINQLNRQYDEKAMEILGTDLVEVSAHSGARDTGEGFENHKSWQGKVYRWKK